MGQQMPVGGDGQQNAQATQQKSTASMQQYPGMQQGMQQPQQQQSSGLGAQLLAALMNGKSMN